LRPYTPPSHLSLETLNQHWSTWIEAEGERKKIITNYIREAKDLLRKQFANQANSFQTELNSISLALSNLEGDLENQLAVSQSLIKQLDPLKSQLKNLSQLDNQLIEANIDDNEYTIYSVEDLGFELGLVTQNVIKKSAFIENQIVARSKTNFTPQQLEQYSETFRTFDKDNSNSLVREEFKAALQAEGTAFEAEEFEKTFLSLSGGGNEIFFEQVMPNSSSLLNMHVVWKKTR
jgi:hypothetical protein